MSQDTKPSSAQRQRLIVVAIALVLAGAGLVVWLLSENEPMQPAQPDAATPSEPAIDAREAGPADALTFDAEEVGRKPKPPRRKITSREVRAIQRRYASQIKYCYQKPSQRAAVLIKRKTNVVVHLAPFGRVTRVDVHGGGDRELQACLRRFIKQWHFPRNLGQQQVSFPIVFAR